MVSLKKLSKKMMVAFSVIALLNNGCVNSFLYAKEAPGKMSDDERQEIKKAINVIKEQKEAVSKVLQVGANASKETNMTEKIVNHAGYVMGAGVAAWIASLILNEKMIKIVGFLASYIALVITFEYLPFESNESLQRENLEKIKVQLETHQEALERILARGEWQLASN